MFQVASWIVDQIKTAHRDQPFFIAAGFFLPHVPCYATQKWFDLYPDEDSVLPKVLEGLSLIAQLRDAATKRERPAITSHNRGNHGIHSERWRYINDADGSEELYDLQADPNEWNNFAGSSKYAPVIAEHRHWLPKIDRPPAPGSAHRVLAYDRETDEAVWEGNTVRRTDPIPH